MESSPLFRNLAHAHWTPSTIAGGSSERLALYQDSTRCQSPVGGWRQVTTPGAFTFDVVGEHLHAFRVETRDASGRIVTSPCSPRLDVRRFDWTTLGPRYWPELRDRMQAVIGQGVTQAVTVRQITGATFAAISGGRFQGAIVVPGSTVYGIPRVAPQIATLDFAASTTPVGKLVGPTLGGVDTWYGAALARNGVVYSPPSDIAYVLRFDPAQIAQAAPIKAVDLGTGAQDNKWAGLRLAPNGLLIACPREDERVLVIDPADSSPGGIRRVGPSLGKAEKWIGGVLAPNGKIYCIPSHAAQILEIDPDNLTVTGIKKVGPDFGTKGTKWWGGALGPNGNIYAAPYRDTKVLEIVPDNISQSRRVGPDFGVPPEGGGGNWTWGTLAPNGKIYATPGNRDHVLEIDPADLSLTGIHRVGSKLAGSSYQKYFSAVLAPNGKLYAFPWFGSSTILEIDPHARGKFDTDLLLNGHLNGQWNEAGPGRQRPMRGGAVIVAGQSGRSCNLAFPARPEEDTTPVARTGIWHRFVNFRGDGMRGRAPSQDQAVAINTRPWSPGEWSRGSPGMVARNDSSEGQTPGAAIILYSEKASGLRTLSTRE